MELAQIMSRYQFRKIKFVFIAFAAEEYGLFGSWLICRRRPSRGTKKIEALFNNDIIGSDAATEPLRMRE